MMAVTHAAIAGAVAQLVLGKTSAEILGLAVIGSQLPDLDTTHSLIGRLPVLGAIAQWLEARYPHRSVTHCLWATVALVAACLPLYYWGDWQIWLALPLGHLSAAIADTHTPQGVALLWPLPHRVYFTRNPRLQVATGSKGEIWLLAAAVAIALGIANLNLGGGLWIYLSNLIGDTNSVERVYNRAGNSQQIWVEFKGLRASDRAPIRQEFFLIDLQGKTLVLQDKEGIYKTGDQLIPERLKAVAKAPATVQTLAIAWEEEEEILPKLVALWEAHPGAAIYLSGNLQLDAPEEVQAPAEAGKVRIITVTGNRAQLAWSPLEEAGRQLGGQWVSGQLEARIIFPKPEFE